MNRGKPSKPFKECVLVKLFQAYMNNSDKYLLISYFLTRQCSGPVVYIPYGGRGPKCWEFFIAIFNSECRLRTESSRIETFNSKLSNKLQTTHTADALKFTVTLGDADVYMTA